VNQPAPRTVKRFVKELASLQVAAGSPSLNRIEGLSKGRVPVSTASDALKGDRIPELRFVLNFVAACRQAARADGLDIPDGPFDPIKWQNRWVEVKRLGWGGRSSPCAP